MTDEAKDKDAQAQTLGLIRWVGLAFMVFGLIVLWLLDRTMNLVWSIFAEPNPTLISAISLIVAAGTTLVLYRKEDVNKLAYEIVGELSRVTWPSRDETTNSTIVVIIASVIAALILGGFDTVWSTVTDLIYTDKA